MNPRERFLKTLKGERADRVPLDLQGFRCPTEADIDKHPDPLFREVTRRVFHESLLMFHVPTGINRYLMTPEHRFKHTDSRGPDNTEIATTEIDTPRGKLTAVIERNDQSDTGWMVKYPVESLEDIEKIRSVPWELPSELGPPDMRKLPADWKERYVISASISSPFVCVAGMMNYQYFLELCATELNLVKELTAQCRERIMSVLDVVLADKNVEHVWMGGCEWVTPPMGSPRIYEELVQQFDQPVIDRIHAGGALCQVHCHGNIRSTLEMIIARGADYTEPVEPPPDGDITFAEAKRVAAGRITLGGNIEVRIIVNEGTEEVEAATRSAFEGGKLRMILKPSEGVLGRLTPRIVANYHRIIDVWEELSPIE